MAGRERLDRLLVRRGLFPSREAARAAILAGRVRVAGAPGLLKPGTPVPADAAVTVEGEPRPYVSRGGQKLEHALRVLGVDPAGRVCLDVGASTGGFTDCLLRHGAAQVVAVDVGYGQLAWALRNDPRVTVLERTHVRRLTAALLPACPTLATVDVSFISLRKFLGHLGHLLAPRAEVLCLVKPQFEAGRADVGKRGVVRDPAVHRRVLLEVGAYAASRGYQLSGLTASPLRGPEGNVEYFLHLTKEGPILPDEGSSGGGGEGQDHGPSGEGGAAAVPAAFAAAVERVVRAAGHGGRGEENDGTWRRGDGGGRQGDGTPEGVS